MVVNLSRYPLSLASNHPKDLVYEMRAEVPRDTAAFGLLQKPSAEKPGSLRTQDEVDLSYGASIDEVLH